MTSTTPPSPSAPVPFVSWKPKGNGDCVTEHVEPSLLLDEEDSYQLDLVVSDNDDEVSLLSMSSLPEYCPDTMLHLWAAIKLQSAVRSYLVRVHLQATLRSQLAQGACLRQETTAAATTTSMTLQTMARGQLPVHTTSKKRGGKVSSAVRKLRTKLLLRKKNYNKTKSTEYDQDEDDDFLMELLIVGPQLPVSPLSSFDYDDDEEEEEEDTMPYNAGCPFSKDALAQIFVAKKSHDPEIKPKIILNTTSLMLETMEVSLDDMMSANDSLVEPTSISDASSTDCSPTTSATMIQKVAPHFSTTKAKTSQRRRLWCVWMMVLIMTFMVGVASNIMMPPNNNHTVPLKSSSSSSSSSSSAPLAMFFQGHIIAQP